MLAAVGLVHCSSMALCLPEKRFHPTSAACATALERRSCPLSLKFMRFKHSPASDAGRISTGGRLARLTSLKHAALAPDQLPRVSPQPPPARLIQTHQCITSVEESTQRARPRPAGPRGGRTGRRPTRAVVRIGFIKAFISIGSRPWAGRSACAPRRPARATGEPAAASRPRSGGVRVVPTAGAPRRGAGAPEEGTAGPSRAAGSSDAGGGVVFRAASHSGVGGFQPHDFLPNTTQILCFVNDGVEF